MKNNISLNQFLVIIAMVKDTMSITPQMIIPGRSQHKSSKSLLYVIKILKITKVVVITILIAFNKMLFMTDTY